MSWREIARYADFIDGGFLKKAGAKTLGADARKLQLAPAALVGWVQGLQPFQRPDELLRVYWYEGEFDSADARHAAQKKSRSSERVECLQGTVCVSGSATAASRRRSGAR